MKIHFIAIGGSAMHNLAIALHKKGYLITGSDDEIFEPSRGRLLKYGLLPTENGWFPEKISQQLDAVIVGMHARADNPELIKAQELGLKIFSYPDYLYEQSKDKTRIVIGGSHGKTTITSMVIHAFRYAGIDCDYMVGAKLDGFEVMVKLTHEARYMILEGDEYLTSPLDRTPKFHHYFPHIALISGVAWDHINVFPTFDNYIDQFAKYIDTIQEDGSLVYCRKDSEVKQLCESKSGEYYKYGYDIPEHRIENGTTILLHNRAEYKLKIFGDHNLLNLSGAWLVCKQAGISDEQFLKAMTSFKGASNRLELVAENESSKVFKDFAHAPSKLEATIKATKKQYPEQFLVACMELHTFSSLSEQFLEQYKGAMDDADLAFVYFNPKALEHKKLPMISIEQVEDAFANKHLEVFNDSDSLIRKLKSIDWNQKNLLFMTSGNFDGVNFVKLAEQIIK